MSAALRLGSYMPALWTERHKKERAFNEAKRQSRKVECAISNHIMESEVTLSLNEAADQEIERRTTSLKNRQRIAAKHLATLSAKGIPVDALTGSTFFVCDSVRSLPVEATSWPHATQVSDEADATVFVVKDPVQTKTKQKNKKLILKKTDPGCVTERISWRLACEELGLSRQMFGCSAHLVLA